MTGASGRRPSLRARLVTGSTVVLVAAVLTADVTAYLALRGHLRGRATDALETAAGRIEAAPAGRRVSLGPNMIQSLVPTGLFIVLLDEDGEALLTSADAGADGAPADDATAHLDSYPLGKIVEDDVAGGAHLLLRVDVPAGSVVTAGDDPSARVTQVLLGADLGPAAETTAALVRTELVVGLLILAAWGAAAWTVIGLGLRPLKTMAVAAQRVAAHRSGRLPAGDPKSETGALAAALNQAFDVRARAEEQARGFLADASHELRTPLASIRAWTELYRVGGIADEHGVREAMASMESDARRMSGVVEQMLELARLESVAPSVGRTVDLAALVRTVADDLRPWAADRLHLDLPPTAVEIAGDRDELRALVENLVRNALLHAGETAQVRVEVGRDAGHAVVVVSDDGPGLTAEEMEHAFDRFWRADSARARPGGSGLGLPIALEVARRHGGRVTLSPRSPTGLVATAAFPAGGRTSADVQDEGSGREA